MNSGSVDSLNVSWRCGCSPNARQIREIAVWVSPTSPGHRPRRPVRRVLGRRLQRLDDHLFDLVVGDRPWPARPGLVEQPVEPVARKPRTPLAHRRVIQPQTLRDLGVLQPLSRRQHDPRALRQRLSALPPPRPRLQLLPLRLRRLNRNSNRNRHTSCLPRRHQFVHQDAAEAEQRISDSVYDPPVHLRRDRTDPACQGTDPPAHVLCFP